MTSNKSSIGILGAGISGLCVAYALKSRGVDVTLYEKKDTVGGVIQSEKSNNWLAELGPNTILVRSNKVWKMLQDLNLDTEIQEADQKSKRRFIVRDDRLIPLPISFVNFLTTDLFTIGAKFGLLKEPFVTAPENKDDESIASFVKRRLGKELLDYAVNPFVAGIFAGDPQQLSVKHTFPILKELEQKHGSLLKGIMKRTRTSSSRKALISFKDGLQTLPLTIHKKIQNSVKLNHALTGLYFDKKRWHLQFEHHKEEEHDIIVSTLPAYALAECVQGEKISEIVSGLKNIPYAPMSVVHLGYRKDQIQHTLDGFGMLIPENEDYKILGTLFSSSLFPRRAPEGHTLLTSFIGGARYPKLARLPKKDLVEQIQLELDQLLEITGTPEFVKHTYWEKAIPQYKIGYDKFLDKMDDIEDKLSGLYLAGNFKGGVSVPDCIKNGLQTAEKVAGNLS